MPTKQSDLTVLLQRLLTAITPLMPPGHSLAIAVTDPAGTAATAVSPGFSLAVLVAMTMPDPDTAALVLVPGNDKTVH